MSRFRGPLASRVPLRGVDVQNRWLPLNLSTPHLRVGLGPAVRSMYGIYVFLQLLRGPKAILLENRSRGF